jgi:1-phosphofructokinase family hexose kinase
LIVTLTLNPAIDHIVSADRLVYDDRSHILATSEAAGGRGINASNVIASFGGKTRAITVQGGHSGQLLEKFLQGCRFPVQLVPIRNEIRTNLTITDRQGLTIKLNERGPELNASELDAITEAVTQQMPKMKWLLLCGSMPPNVPTSFYARLIEAARNHGVNTLLDADGDGFAEGIEAGPTIVKPNQQEAERILGKALLTKANFVEGVERLHSMGAQSVILTLGSRGAIGLNGDRIHEAIPPSIDAISPIGSGDAFSAAATWALAKGKEFYEALRWGVAAGTASARLPGVSFATFEEVKVIYKKVDVRSLR